ncbi:MULTISPECIES: hypothetical protein [unclassified Clostridium]|uniref:hypothetical protein n=1 Tax=unclassified Clostridium TaxID=2614128 RepID=UPI00207AD309|nr:MULTISPECIES: hypothetical protein [unclassified Clostridium]
MGVIVSCIFIGLLIGIANTLKKHANTSSNTQNILYLADNEPLPIVQGNIILKQNEICHYCGNALLRKIKNKIIGYSGGGSGMSFRIAKGVTYRTSGSKRISIRENVAEDYAGMLNITNKRVIFIGEKGFNHNIDTLISIVPYSDAIEMQFSSKNYIIMTNNGNYIYQIVQRLVDNTEKNVKSKKLPNGLEYYENKSDWNKNKILN